MHANLVNLLLVGLLETKFPLFFFCQSSAQHTAAGSKAFISFIKSSVILCVFSHNEKTETFVLRKH